MVFKIKSHYLKTEPLSPKLAKIYIKIHIQIHTYIYIQKQKKLHFLRSNPNHEIYTWGNHVKNASKADIYFSRLTCKQCKLPSSGQNEKQQAQKTKWVCYSPHNIRYERVKEKKVKCSQYLKHKTTALIHYQQICCQFHMSVYVLTSL